MSKLSNRFEQIFLKNERIILEGENKSNLIYLIFILVLTFLSLAFVLGGFRNLKQRMDNPFSNWINVEVPMSKMKDKNYLKFEKALEESSTLESFHISGQTDYTIGKWTVIPNLEEGYGYFESRARTFTEEDANLKEVVFDPSNVLYQYQNDSTFTSYKGITITKKLYNNLGYLTTDDVNPEAKDIFLLIEDKKIDHIFHKVRVDYIVNELPGNIEILSSSDLFYALESKDILFEDYGIEMTKYRNDVQLVSNMELDLNLLDEMVPSSVIVENINLIDSIFMGDDAIFYIYLTTFRNKLPFRVPINFPDSTSMMKIVNKLYNNKIFAIVPSKFHTPQNITLVEDYRSFYFSSLSKVIDFRNFAKNYKFNISKLQVESRYNFYLVSILARFFITLIIILSLLAIILYLQNVISNHLEKIKQNLGTLMAFGLSKKEIISMYLKILMRYFFKASFISFMILLIIYLVNRFTIQSPYLEIASINLPLIWILLAVVLAIYFRRLVKKILFKTPGELIYNRS